ncbi:MAG: class D sortase [Bacilli bacterium]|nr:class D sortase [Bacilli bacterium]
MKNKIIFLLLIFFFLIPSSKAATKEDLYNLVDSQTVCDSNTSALFEKYKVYYKRVVKTKDLTSDELDQIISKINYVLNIVNQKSICKISDLSKLSTTEKLNIYNALMSGTNIINNAPDLTGNTSEEGSSEVIVNPSDKTVYIYDNGSLSDTIILDETTLTYTGPNIYVTIIFILVIVFLSVPFIYVLTSKTKLGKFIKKWNPIYNTLLASLSMVFIVSSFTYLVLEKNISLVNSAKNLFKETMIEENESQNKTIILDENKEIMSYPAVGDNYATLIINSLGINHEISFGDSQKLLSTFIGHSTGSYLPGEGGTIVLSGHNSSDFLANLKNIKNDDIITIETTYGTFNYEVKETSIVTNTDLDSIKVSDEGENLILYTCYPFDSVLYTNQRLVVYADLIETRWKDN